MKSIIWVLVGIVVWIQNIHAIEIQRDVLSQWVRRSENKLYELVRERQVEWICSKEDIGRVYELPMTSGDIVPLKCTNEGVFSWRAVISVCQLSNRMDAEIDCRV